MYNIDRILETYNKVMKVCQSSGFVLSLDRKIYRKEDLTYDFVVDNAPRIAYIEDTNVDQSRIYLSTFIMLLLTFSLDRTRSGEQGVEFIPIKESLVTLMYRISLWNINSGYNTAINDVKALISKLDKDSNNLGGTI